MIDNEIREGNSFRVLAPHSLDSLKVHICYILRSRAYPKTTLIVYKYYVRRHQYWREVMCTKKEMEFYIERYQSYLDCLEGEKC